MQTLAASNLFCTTDRTLRAGRGRGRGSRRFATAGEPGSRLDPNGLLEKERRRQHYLRRVLGVDTDVELSHSGDNARGSSSPIKNVKTRGPFADPEASVQRRVCDRPSVTLTSVGGILTDIAPVGLGGELYFFGRTASTSLWWWQQTGGLWTGSATMALPQGPRRGAPLDPIFLRFAAQL